MPEIDVRDLNSVRRAAGQEAGFMKSEPSSSRFHLMKSPVARKVLICNGLGGLAILAWVFATERSTELTPSFWIGGVLVLLAYFALSLWLALHLAKPLAALASLRGRDPMRGGQRISVPDLNERHDEIGDLASGMNATFDALYDRVESNEQFAADVAHEIKNPLASLRSAVGTLRLAQRADQRDELLRVIEHDVVRLDRLVTDISNASRLDSELVQERQEQFDLCKTLRDLSEYLGGQAEAEGIDFISDIPEKPLRVMGIEGRLAQVFVNLITNAISFCAPGDAIRVWLRAQKGRILVVVEDTGPGIPDEALTKIFQRFYSERPQRQFGNNSGLGLAISQQIIEAHGGRIWAENIVPTAYDPDSEPLGARFVVDLSL